MRHDACINELGEISQIEIEMLFGYIALLFLCVVHRIIRRS
jgi:hypothetical protein